MTGVSKLACTLNTAVATAADCAQSTCRIYIVDVLAYRDMFLNRDVLLQRFFRTKMSSYGDALLRRVS